MPYLYRDGTRVRILSHGGSIYLSGTDQEVCLEVVGQIGVVKGLNSTDRSPEGDQYIPVYLEDGKYVIWVFDDEIEIAEGESFHENVSS